MAAPDFSEVGRITKLVVKHASDAFISPELIGDQWRALNFTGPPSFTHAVDEYERFIDLLGRSGAEILRLPREDGVSIDSIYVRDASVVTPAGIVLCRMGKAQRATEPLAQDRAFLEFGIPVIGAIEPPGQLEGGDVVWLDRRTVAVGRGYRTNDEGIRQLAALAGDAVEVIPVPLVHWRGPRDVFHLMSIISPVDTNLAVVYAPLLPVPFRERLVAMGFDFIEVPDEEFDSMGANVLAIAPRQCVVVAGNPRTRTQLEEAGAEVLVYSGEEISLKGGGGPTCLTRPIVRAVVT